jgi:hypothetical protein
MNFRLIKSYIFLVALLMTFPASSQTIGGGEVYYRLISSKQYLVTAKVYRQCSGAPLNNLQAYVVSDSFKISMNMQRVNIRRLDSACGNPCNIVNDSSNAGYEVHTFTDTVDFNSAPYDQFVKAGNCQVHFAIHQYLRGTTTTLASNSTTQSFYLNAMVDICRNIQKNHSPEFTFIPKLYACCNQPFTYNMGYADSSDFDSLGLDLTTPLTNFKTPVSYVGNFTNQIPMTPYCPPNPGVINCKALPSAKPPRGFYFDKEIGDIQLTPTKCDETGVIKVTISEYRKDSTNQYVLIGQVSREMFVTVKQCSDNYPPYFIGNIRYSVCENNKLCFTTGIKDDPFLPKQTIPDTVNIEYNYAIPGAQVYLIDSSSREKDFGFCWQTSKQTGGYQNRIGLMAYDKNCMLNMRSRGYIITKKPALDIDLKVFTRCNKLYFEILNKDTINHNNKHLVYNVKLRPYTSPSSILFQSSKSKDSFALSKSGQYYVELTANNVIFNCPKVYVDTIDIKDIQFEIGQASDTLFCFNDTVRLSPVPALSNSFQYQWYDSEKGKLPADTGSTYSFLNNTAFRTIHLITTDKNHCLLSDTIRVISRGALERTPKDTAWKVCENELSSIKIWRMYGKPPFTINWYLNNQYYGSDSTLNYKLSKSSPLKIEITDSFNCPYVELANIYVTKKPKITMRDTALCYNDTVWIASGVNGAGPFTYEWKLDQNLTTQKGKDFKLIVKGDHLLKVKVSEGNCSSEKTILVNYLALPQFNILADTVFNKADYIKTDLDQSFAGYKWFNGANTKVNEFWAYTLGAPGMYTIWCDVTDSNGCKSRDALNIRTNGRTSVDETEYSNLKVYPNPVFNNLTIECIHPMTLEIYNSAGQLVIESRLLAGKNDINTEALASGVYTVKIGDVFYKLIKLP